MFNPAPVLLGVLTRVVLLLHGQVGHRPHDFGRLHLELAHISELVQLAEGSPIPVPT